MDITIKTSKLKPRNIIAKDLRTSKYRMRTEKSKVAYNRKTEKQKAKDFFNGY
jgi:hypothetical protein